jgi:L-fuconolactonase
LRIDSHQYFWVREGHSYLPEALGPILNRNKFDGSVAVAAQRTVDDTRRLLELASQHDFVRGVLGWAEDAETLDEFETHPKFLGVAMRLEERIPVEELQRRGLTLDLMLAARDLPRVARLAESAPELRIVIDHMAAGPFDEWSRGMAAVEGMPQVFCKISGLYRSGLDLRPHVQHLLKKWGPGRLMFGSDWPAALPQYSWKENLACFTQAIGAQTIETREQLLGETARRVYRLE